MKKLLLSVNAVSPDNNDTASVFYVHLDSSAIERIKTLSMAAVDIDVYEMSDFNSWGVWSSHFVDQQEAKEDDFDLDEAVAEMKAQLFSHDGGMLHVTAEEFYFSCLPKNQGDDLKMETARVCVALLDSCDTVIDL